jgi:rhomboid family protein
MVLPLYDDNPFKLPHRPIVTWTLIGLNILIFLVQSSAGNDDALVLGMAVIPAAFVGDVSVPGLSPVTTLLTYQFLHASLLHVLGNMIFLWVFGDDIEEVLGRARFLFFYLTCGMIGGLAFVVSAPHAQTPLIGASGSISGIVIAYVMLRPCAKVTVLTFFIPMRISAYWVVSFFVIMQFVSLESSSASEVAYWCHIGGMAGGALLFPLLRPSGVRLFECIRTPHQPPPAAPEIPISSDRGSPWDRRGPWG